MTGPGAGCRGSRLLATSANGCPAFAQYKADGSPWSIQVVDISGDRIAALHYFVVDGDPALFAAFGLPDHL